VLRIHRHDGDVEGRPIKRIEELHAEFDTVIFSDSRVLREREIPVVNAGSFQNAVTRIAERAAVRKSQTPMCRTIGSDCVHLTAACRRQRGSGEQN